MSHVTMNANSAKQVINPIVLHDQEVEDLFDLVESSN